VASLCALVAAQARAADDDERFGARGRVLVTGSLAVQVVSTDAAGSSAATTFELSPGVQLFVARNVAAGVNLQLSVAGGGPTFTSVGLQPSLGYNVDLSAGISWLPQVTLGFARTATTVFASSTSVNRWSLGGFAPLIVRPKGNLFLGVGPALTTDFAATSSSGDAARQTIFSFRSLLGGWF
jgi:hypothetical protein